MMLQNGQLDQSKTLNIAQNLKRDQKPQNLIFQVYHQRQYCCAIIILVKWC